MEKTKKYIFLILILLFLSSCVLKKNTKEVTSNEPNLIKITEKYSRELSDGSYKKNNFFKNFNIESQESINKKALYQGIDHYRTIVGDFKSIEKVQLTEQSVLLILDNELRKSSEIYTYDNSGKLTNISTFPGAIKKESNKYYTVKPIELYKDNLIIPGALTMPKGVENPPLVIMVTGLGPYDMDETIGLSGNQPFKDIAIGLAKNNIASLRYDKSTLHGNVKINIQNEYFNDFDAAYDFVKSLNNVDLDNIYILSHDQGAMLAPTMAKNKNIKGIALMSGSLRSLADIIFDQNEMLLKQSTGINDGDKRKQIDTVAKEAEKAKSINVNSKKGAFELKPSYWASLNALNTKEDILNFPGKLLIMQAKNDFQILTNRNYYEYVDLLSNHENVKFKLFEGLNHIYSESENNNYDMSIYDKESSVRSDVIDEISQWINN